MRELEVLNSGHLKLDWEERKAFELDEQVRSSVKQMLEQALEAERSARPISSLTNPASTGSFLLTYHRRIMYIMFPRYTLKPR